MKFGNISQQTTTNKLKVKRICFLINYYKMYHLFNLITFLLWWSIYLTVKATDLIEHYRCEFFLVSFYSESICFRVNVLFYIFDFSVSIKNLAEVYYPSSKRNSKYDSDKKPPSVSTKLCWKYPIRLRKYSTKHSNCSINPSGFNWIYTALKSMSKFCLRFCKTRKIPRSKHTFCFI